MTRLLFKCKSAKELLKTDAVNFSTCFLYLMHFVSINIYCFIPRKIKSVIETDLRLDNIIAYTNEKASIVWFSPEGIYKCLTYSELMFVVLNLKMVVANQTKKKVNWNYIMYVNKKWRHFIGVNI